VQRRKWLRFDHAQWTLREALQHLNTFVDESDPDVDFSNDYHAFQTAEAIRREHPDKPWLQLTGLIHDVGKVLTIFNQPQWATVGDTYIIGCAPAPHVVFSEHTFGDNVDMHDARYKYV
jgi:inositol oxygenase